MPTTRIIAEYTFPESELKEHFIEILDMSEGLVVPVEEISIKARVNIPEDYKPGKPYNLHVSELIVLWGRYPEEVEVDPE